MLRYGGSAASRSFVLLRTQILAPRLRQHSQTLIPSTFRPQQQQLLSPGRRTIWRSLCGGAPSAAHAASVAAPLASHATSRLPGLVQLYLQFLQKRPILTKSITAGTIYFFADITSQVISSSKSDDTETLEWDVGRTLRMVTAGLFISGPSLHLWFNFMSRCFPKRDLASTLKKMALGQTVYGPIFTVIFFSLNAFVQGESVDEVISRLRRDFFTTIRSGLMYWPFCDFITYRYVPVHLQPLVSNSFSFVWTIYFTYMACLKKVECPA